MPDDEEYHFGPSKRRKLRDSPTHPRGLVPLVEGDVRRERRGPGTTGRRPRAPRMCTVRLCPGGGRLRAPPQSATHVRSSPVLWWRATMSPTRGGNFDTHRLRGSRTSTSLADGPLGSASLHACRGSMSTSQCDALQKICHSTRRHSIPSVRKSNSKTGSAVLSSRTPTLVTIGI